jgi:hypothetical protein
VLELRVELDYARKLIQFSETILSGTHHASNGEFTRKDYVPLTLICKACATFEGIVLLVQHGNSDDSLSLLRTLVESTVNSAYLWLKGDESADLFADFRSFREWIEYRDLNALEPMLTSYLTPEEAREMESHFVELRPKFKNQNDWCTEGLFQRAVYVDEQITSRLKDRLSPADFEEKIGHEHQNYRILVRLHWRTGSAFVHGTAAALRGRVCISEKGEIEIGGNRSPVELAWAMFLSNYAMLQLLALANDILGGKHGAEWQRLYGEHFLHKSTAPFS